MNKKILTFFGLSLLAVPILFSLPIFGWADGVGFTALDFRDSARDRPIKIKLWYPVEPSRRRSAPAYDLAFQAHARKDAEYLEGTTRRPLILLSHGDRGSNVDQSWLAEALVAEGYIVAAVSHWQNTWRNNTPEATLQVWERPKDLSATLDQLLAHGVWGPRIDAGRIAAAGHSAGGYTALAVAGAIYNPLKMSRYCEALAGARECSLGDGANLESIDFTQARLSYRDPRIKAVVAMAPALGPGIRQESLAAIDTPALIIAATDDELLQYDLNAAHYARHIPHAEVLPLARGGHFVFMPECTLAGSAFTYFHRFDICGHRGNVAEERPALHAQVSQAVEAFFGANLGDKDTTMQRDIKP